MSKVMINLAGMDWSALSDQKKTLNRTRTMQINELHPQEMERLSGLIHLLDNLQYQAAKTLGKKAVFGTPEEKRIIGIIMKDGAIQDVEMPDDVVVIVKDYDVPEDWEGPVEKDDEGDTYQRFSYF